MPSYRNQSIDLLPQICNPSVVMLISFYCTIMKQSIDCNPMIGKQNWTRFYVGMFIITSLICLKIVKYIGVVYVTIGNPAFCLALYLTGVHFRGKLQKVGDVNEQKIKCRPIRTREIDGGRLWQTIRVFKLQRNCYNFFSLIL